MDFRGSGSRLLPIRLMCHGCITSLSKLYYIEPVDISSARPWVMTNRIGWSRITRLAFFCRLSQISSALHIKHKSVALYRGNRIHTVGREWDFITGILRIISLAKHGAARIHIDAFSDDKWIPWSVHRPFDLVLGDAWTKKGRTVLL